jgi:hypothetical protein
MKIIKAHKEDLSVDSKKGFGISEIPGFLFNEISEQLGIGEETTISTRGMGYRFRKLNPNHKITGFEGAIGIRSVGRHTKHVTFALWGVLPRGEDDVFEPEPILELTAGPENGGLWAYGSGNYVVEKIRAGFPFTDLALGYPAIRFLCLVLYRASEMAENPICVKDHYWEADRFPGNYTE